MSMRKYIPVDGTGDWQTLLDSNYHHLCRSVRPEAFFSWLRSKAVFTSDDQEEIENKYMTTVMKSGHLIDKVKTKGVRGFKAFMEVVEYIYPDTFNILTGIQPRKPPSEFEPNASIGGSVVREKRGPALSAEILGQMGDLVKVLSQANACKKEELDKLQTYVTTLQQENQTMCEENRSILLKFKDAQEEIEQVKQKLNVQEVKCEHDAKERKTILKECERLRELKDKYMDDCLRLRQDRDDLDNRMLKLTERDIVRSRTCRIPDGSQLEQIRDENRKLLLEREKLLASVADFQSRLSEQNSEVKCKGTTAEQNSDANRERLGQASSLPTTTDQQILELELSRDELDLKAKEWQNKFTTLQDRYDCVLVNLEEVKTERNQIRNQSEDLQSMYEKEREENKRLVADCEKYQDRFCDMESQMSSLKMELQSMQASVCSPNLSVKGRGFCDLHNGSCTNDGCVTSTAEGHHSNGWKDRLMGRQKGREEVERERWRDLRKGTGRPLEEIHQTPGLCPYLKRRVVVTNKPQKAPSFSSA